MLQGQALIYRYNNIYNSTQGQRNKFALVDINANTKEEFRNAIQHYLEGIKPGTGYLIVKWNGKHFICEKDLNNPEVDYVRIELKYHPLLNKFTI